LGYISVIIRYDSIAALRNAYITLGLGRGNPHGASLSWFNNESEADTLRLAEYGDTTLVAAAEAQLSKLDAAIETPRKIWERSPAGAFCSVPDVLAGLPTPMRRQRYEQDETNPITIYADTASSAGIPAHIFAERGITILALVMALARIRPVSLYQMDVGNGPNDRSGETVVVAQINTHPLDLATACYVLTSVGYARRLCYTIEEKLNGFTGAWPQGYSHATPMLYYNALCQRLGADAKHTLMIPGAHIRDEIITQPIAWINKQIQYFTQRNDED
jgi:hypothetical protein